MGSTASNTLVLEGVKELKKGANPFLGDFSEVMLQETEQMAFLKVFCGSDEHEHRERIRKVKQRKNKVHPNILALLRMDEAIDSELCGKTCRLYCFYELFDQDLQCVYGERLVNRQKFTEEELMDIAISCVNGLIYIQDNELKRCYLSKKSIVYVRRSVKILDHCIVEQPHPYFLLHERTEVEDDVFLSPELMMELSKGNADPYISPKSDIFTLGVLLINLALFEPMTCYFDYDRCIIDFQRLQEKVEKIPYSENLKNLIRMMLTGGEEERPGLLTVQEKLMGSRRNTFQLNQRTMKKVEDQFELEPIGMSKKKSKTVHSSINLHSADRLDKVKVSSDEVPPAVLSIPALHLSNKKRLPKAITAKSQERSISEYSTILNHLNSNVHAYQAEDQSTGQTVNNNIIQNYGTTVSFGADSPIQKMKGLMDATYRSIEQDSSPKYGRIAYMDGSYYEGELKNGLAHGNGILYFQKDKVKYSGSWCQNQYQGFGTLHTMNPIKSTIPLNLQDLDLNTRYCLWYEGQFHCNLKSGFGSLYYSNGQKFSGCFREDRANGYGTFYRSDHSHTNGLWSSNKLSR